MDLNSASSIVLQVLTQATSQETAVLKPAEEQLKQWETQPGFYSVLLVSYSNQILLFYFPSVFSMFQRAVLWDRSRGGLAPFSPVLGDREHGRSRARRAVAGMCSYAATSHNLFLVIFSAFPPYLWSSLQNEEQNVCCSTLRIYALKRQQSIFTNSGHKSFVTLCSH